MTIIVKVLITVTIDNSGNNMNSNCVNSETVKLYHSVTVQHYFPVIFSNMKYTKNMAGTTQ